MTTPEERTRAVIQTRDFLEMLSNPGNALSPVEVMVEATRLLRHFPLNVDLDFSASVLPTVWSPPIRRREKSR
ncbi:BPSL0761 family protein [Caballeronia grimmiae]|uniref:BPSL0761 family protein n=1 Tax=Caballeronia grimmiae TaxID=1071679 RepID=UPI0038BA3BCB